MKKRVLAVLLASMMLITAMAGCGNGSGTPAANGGEPAAAGDGNESTGGAIRVGLTMAQRDQFLTSLELAATADAKSRGDIDLTVVDADNDISTQISQVQTWASSGFDAAIVCLVNNDSANEIISAAGDMKVIFVNRQPDLSVLQDDKVVYVGTDETLYGKEQADFLADYFETEGKTEIDVVIFMGELGLDNTTKRTQSVKDGLADRGLTVNYVMEDTAEWSRSKAMDKFVQFMGSGQNVDAVICNNDEMALGVVEAMLTSGSREVLCPVVGIDATEVGCAGISDGTLAATVFQDPEAQGKGVIECAVGLATGTPVDNLVDNYYNILPQLVTLDNVADFT